MKKIIFAFTSIIPALFILLLTIGCSRHKEELMYPENCTVPDSAYFNTNILPIISENCYSCHSSSKYNSSGGNVNLEGYANIVAAMQDEILLKVIRHEPGFSRMPKGAMKLSECKISTIQKWVDQGMQNN